MQPGGGTLGEPAAEEIEVATAHAMWQAGDVIVDVRLHEEFAGGHVAGAVNIPLRELAVRERELPAGQVITVCSTGIRSRRGAATLARAGRTSFSLRGGTKAWAAAGHPVVVGTEPGPRRRRAWWRRLLPT
jgi:rhodanese-related sulfurtransferase